MLKMGLFLEHVEFYTHLVNNLIATLFESRLQLVYTDKLLGGMKGNVQTTIQLSAFIP